MASTTAFALALEQLDGVGWVTADRLLQHFDSYEALLRYPREQVLTRIKGVAKAESLVKSLFDEEEMRQRLDEASTREDALAEKGVRLLTRWHDDWPDRLEDLPRGQRPFLLYGYGHTDVLPRPLVAFFARPPLATGPFETAQQLVRHLKAQQVLPATGAAHGFDVVVHKLAQADPPLPSLLVASSGLSHLPRSLRPIASGTARTGGLLLSPFPMNHGPFDHDDRTRALLLAALAEATVFVDCQPRTPEWKAMAWALTSGRPVFTLDDADRSLPEGVNRLDGTADFEVVSRAVLEASADGNR